MFYCVNRLCRAASLLLISLLISGCGLQSSRVGDDLTLDKLTRSNTGVAIMQMGQGQNRCPGSNLTLAKKVSDWYDPVEHVVMRNNLFDKGIPPQIKLASGTYHLIYWECRRGNMIYTLGRRTSKGFLKPSRFRKSFASFTINPGEIVNVGMLRLHTIPGTEKVFFQITDLPPDLHAGLKKERPKIYAQMTTRLMKINLQDMTEKQLQARCKVLQILQRIDKNQALPAYCSGA